MGCCCSNVDKNADERQSLLENDQTDTALAKTGSWFDDDKIELKLDSTMQSTIPKHRRLSSRVSASDDIVENIMQSLDLKENQKPLAIRAVLSSHNKEQAAKQWVNEHKNDIDANQPVTEIFKYKIQAEIEQELIKKITSKIDQKHLNMETELPSKNAQNTELKDNESINELIANWNTEIIDSFASKELLKDECYAFHEIRLSKCLHINRIIFILKTYNEWRDRNENNKFPKVSNMIDIIQLLPDYSIIKLLNDLCHINECHNCNDKKYATLLEYTTTNLGPCTIGICEQFARHYRDKEICDRDDRQRKNTYFGYIESNSVYLCQILDSIHTLCLHSDVKNYKTRQKLIQQIRNNKILSFDEKEKENQDAFINVDSKFITFLNNKNKSRTDTVSELEIGEQFYYWKGKKDHCEEKYYNTVKYDNLREEMFENNIYSISYRMWDDTFQKANKWKQTLRGKQLIAKDYKNMCEIYEIPALSPISIAHIMTVLFYCNYEYLQFKFQNKGMIYAFENKSKDFELLKKNNKEIGNWYKLFTECCVLYGEIIQSQKDRKNMIFYHALNQRQLFSNLNPNFKCFVPTTTSMNVMQNAFNYNENLKENGIILALQQKEMSFDSLFMDCGWMCDYATQKENIFYSSNSLHIIDIMEINSEPSEYINGLLLFDCIFNGKYLDNYLDFQPELIAIITNQMTNRYEFDVRIDKYIQHLFECFLQNNDQNKWIIKSEYKNLDKELQHKLLIFNQIKKTNNFHEGIFVKKWREMLNKRKNKNFKIKIAKEYVFRVENVKVLKELRLNSTNEVVNGEDIVYSLETMDNKENVILGQSIINCKSEPNMYSLVVKLKECPTNIDGINIEFAVCCKEIELNASSRNVYLKTNEMFETLTFAFWDLTEMLQNLTLHLAVKVTNIVYKNE